MLRLVCDRCGVTAKDANPSGWKLVCIHPINSTDEQSRHLCTNCMNGLYRFMSGDTETLDEATKKEIPEWVEAVLERQDPVWFHDEEPLFTPNQVKMHLRATLGVHNEAR